MTKIVTYFNLFPIPDPKEFLGLSADSDEDNVITTLNRNLVVVLKISTQKQIRSWSVLEKLSTKVVYDRHSQKYVGVFAHHALRLWDETTTDVNKCKKLKFQKSIAALVTNDAAEERNADDAGNDEILVLYTDGTTETLSAALASRKEQKELAADQMMLLASQTLGQARLTRLTGGQKLLTYFQRNNKTNAMHLVRHDMATNKCRRFNIVREQVQLAGYAVIDGDNEPMLLTIWSDRRIFLLSLAEHIRRDRAPGNFVSMLSELNVTNNISLLGIGRHTAAIYGANLGQEGSSLLLYNTQFKVVKAKQFFKVYFDFSRLWATPDHILLAMGQNISVISYCMSKALLADLLGTQNNNDNFSAIDLDHINEEESLEQSLKCKLGSNATPTTSEKKAKQPQNETLPKADGKLLAYEPVEDFDRSLHEMSKLQIDAELLAVDNALEDAQVALMASPNDVGAANVLVQMILSQMERCGASEQEVSEKLLTVLIKADQPEHVLMCLRRYAHISGKQIAKVLHYALSRYTATTAAADMETETTKPPAANGTGPRDFKPPSSEYPILDLLAQPYVPPRSLDVALLNAVLACEFDSDTITEHIRREIDYKDVIQLLQHLCNILDAPAVTFEPRPGYEPSCVHFEMQIFRWLGVLLGAHLQNLALSNDLALVNLLYDLQQVLIAYRSQLDELQKVAALLYRLVQRRTLQKEKAHSKWYSIDEVVLY